MLSSRIFVAALTACALAASCGNSGDDAPLAAAGAGGLLTGAGGAGGGGGHVIATSAIGSGGANDAIASSSASATGGSGGASAQCPEKPALGAPLSGPDHQWTWISIPGAKCRDGSDTGIGFRSSSTSKKVFVYLEGGGACFNAATCAVSLATFGQPAFGAWAGTVGLTGIFDPNVAENPVKDWNAIYVPYCTADVHAGSALGADVPGNGTPKNQDFIGYTNMGLYLSRILATFADAPQVLLTGISAGGFGAALNYDRFASAFCPTPVVMLDDSGPPMSDTYLAPCLQKEWRSLWNLATAIPPDCSACTEPDGGGIANYVPYLAKKWPNSRVGLISSTHDGVISTFFGYGTDNCTSSTPIPGNVYEAGLDELRTKYFTSSLWGTYFIGSITHTYLLGPGFYTTIVGGKPLPAWVGDLLDGTPGNIGP